MQFLLLQINKLLKQTYTEFIYYDCVISPAITIY